MTTATIQANPRPAPSRLRFAAFVLLFVYPLVTALQYALMPLTADWPLPARTALFVPLMVAAMVGGSSRLSRPGCGAGCKARHQASARPRVGAFNGCSMRFMVRHLPRAAQSTGPTEAPAHGAVGRWPGARSAPVNPADASIFC
jgi:hypothetical protein